MEKKMDIKLEQDFSAHNIINAMQRFYFFASIQIFEYLVLKTQTWNRLKDETFEYVNSVPI